ncbi:hypothetical protein [Microbacterium sp. TPU 3598]|uniref:hypothetical protein n=1 Tax=Microbacterium sp. TPU 3598 TaxID=1938334 RepID=UPI000BBAABFF|nr:hypothetical protein [Microbacterium sp. TPU 3598]
MVGTEEVAVAFVRDWNVWSFVIAGAALLLSTGFVYVSVPALGILTSARDDTLRVLGGVAWGTGVLAAIGTLAVLPGMIMRHIPEHSNVGWVLLGALVLGVVLLYWALSSSSFGYEFERGFGWVRWIPLGVLLLGTIIGAAVDGLNRAASSIPTTVGTVVVMIVIGAGAIFLWLRDR